MKKTMLATCILATAMSFTALANKDVALTTFKFDTSAITNLIQPNANSTMFHAQFITQHWQSGPFRVLLNPNISIGIGTEPLTLVYLQGYGPEKDRQAKMDMFTNVGPGGCNLAGAYQPGRTYNVKLGVKLLSTDFVGSKYLVTCSMVTH